MIEEVKENKSNGESKNDLQDQDKAHQEIILRNILIKNIGEKYQTFIKAVYELPFAPQNYIDGLKQMDFGMLWLKEAISYAPLSLPKTSEQNG